MPPSGGALAARRLPPRLPPPFLLPHFSSRRILTDPQRFIKRGGYVGIVLDVLNGAGDSLVSSYGSIAFSHYLDGGNGLVFKLADAATSSSPLLLALVLTEADKASQTNMKLVERPGITKLLDIRTKCVSILLIEGSYY